MTKNRAVVLVIVIVAAIAVWWWQGPGPDEAAHGPAVTHPTPAGFSAPAQPTTAATAHLVVSVREAGGPVANAAVRIAPFDGEVVVLVADGQGRATAALAPGRWRIAASAPDHEAAATVRELRAGEHAAVEFVLALGGKPLTGVVTDVNGGPVAGARVDAAALDRIAVASDAVATAVTGSDGGYKLSVATGQLLVGVSHPVYAPQARYVDVGAEGAVADFSLVPGAVIEGVVRDERTGQPVEGAAVISRRDRGGAMVLEEGTHRAVSGPEGRFRLTGLPPGAHELSASRDTRSSGAPALIGVGVAEQVTGVELLIGARPVIRGVVVDDRGAPVPALEVEALGDAPGSLAAATAGADGSFVLAGLVPGRYLITARGPDHVLDAGTPVALATADVDGVRVVVRRGQSIRGHVEPRQVCQVSIDVPRQVDDLHPPGRSSDLPPNTTGADGAFVFAPVPLGPFTVSARCPSGDRGELAGRAAPGMAELVIAMAPGAAIAGRVVDDDGAPVVGVTVAASVTGDTVTVVDGMVTTGVHGITGAAGAFEIAGLAAGTYRLDVLDRGRPMKPKTRPAPVVLAGNDHRTGIELIVERPHGTIKGRVIGSDGEPVADAWVSVHQGVDARLGGMAHDDGAAQLVRAEASDAGDGSSASNELPPALTDAQGAFQITGIPAGAWDVLAEAQAGAQRSRAAQVTPDATIELKVSGLSSLAGTVHGPGGPAALFTAELDGPTPARRTFTGGVFHFARLDPGNYTVRVSSGDGDGETKVSATAGAKATADVSLTPSAAQARPAP